MISGSRLDELRQLFKDDGIALNDDQLMLAAQWLLERARSVYVPIPKEKQSEYARIAEEMRLFKSLYKPNEVRDTRANP